MLNLVATAACAFSPAPAVPATRTATSSVSVVCSMDRRAALFGAAASMLPLAASAKIESVNPANNYYFPMAKYRYLPRIFKAWVAVDQLAPVALEVGDWEGLQEVARRLDDASTALPLYTNAVEGSRSTKRKKKSDAQKQMLKDLKAYNKATEVLVKASDKKDVKMAKQAIEDCRASLLEYRQLAQIDAEDGGVISLPLGNAEEAGHAGAPLGYVVPAFRGGGVSMDYALRPGEVMMSGGVINREYREKFQNDAAADGKKKK